MNAIILLIIFQIRLGRHHRGADASALLCRALCFPDRSDSPDALPGRFESRPHCTRGRPAHAAHVSGAFAQNQLQLECLDDECVRVTLKRSNCFCAGYVHLPRLELKAFLPCLFFKLLSTSPFSHVKCILTFKPAYLYVFSLVCYLSVLALTITFVTMA